MNEDAEATCREVYCETANFYASYKDLISPEHLGYRVLYGPPMKKGSILFIGYQPGGHAIEDIGHHLSWPDQCDYAHAQWLLARRIRYIFSPHVIASCTGTNAIFFRAPTVRYWKRLDREATKRAEEFSIRRVERIAKALIPQRIVVIGLGTFKMLAGNGCTALRNKSRVLANTGDLWGCSATGIIHLSGARVSNSDLEQLRLFFSDMPPVRENATK